jgi:hypothetical protein
MNLFSRILTYVFGVLLGSLMVYFMLFRNRERNLAGWLPKERIMAQIKENPITMTPQAICALNCLGLSESALKEKISAGTINFSRSEVRNEPCPVYFIEIRDIFLNVEVCEKSSQLLNLNSDKSCDC